MSAEGAAALSFDVARTHAEVIEAWSLVYASYRRIGLIDPNPQRLHTTPFAVGNKVAVNLGRLGHQIVSTITAIGDSDAGLPLDCVYKPQIDGLRAAGLKLFEVGLLADRRENISRSANALFDLMRWAFFFAMHHEGTDIIIGVHPHHAAFYRRCLGFEIFAEESVHPGVKDHPVVPLRLDMRAKIQRPPLPRGLTYFLANPVEARTFEGRACLDAQHIRGTLIDHYLREKARPPGDPQPEACITP